MFKVGLSSSLLDITEETFSGLNNSGISDIEVVSRVNDNDEIKYEKIYEYSKKYNINLWSFHLPFEPFETIDISSADESIRKSTVEYLLDKIKKGANIGIDKFVIHPSAEPIEEAKRSIRMENAKKSLFELAEATYKEGGVIAVEDLPRTCLGRNSDEILELIGCNDKLRVCFDTNHLLKEDNINFIDRLGDKIITLHVSDFDFVNERHWLPGEGDNDWSAILKKLNEVGYKGVWMYELGLKAPQTIIRSRDLTFDDFFRNANEIFDNKPITVIGNRAV